LLFCLLVVGVAHGMTNPSAENWCISGATTNGPMVICGSVRVAAAIDYLAWNNMQFINVADHGRELQFAITNASGECYNPTEAGSLNDGAGPTSSSQLLGVNTEGNIYRTTSLPAFWLAPGQRDVNGCYAKNPTIVSNFRSSKQLTVGAWGIPNAIQYLLSTTVGTFQTYLQWEVPTGYMPENFNQFWTLHLANGFLNHTDEGPGETPDPVIISTPDQNYAMGAFLVSAPATYVHYARFNFPAAGTSKWSVVWRHWANMPPGTLFGFETAICVGSLQQVKTCMLTVAQKAGYVPCNGC